MIRLDYLLPNTFDNLVGQLLVVRIIKESDLLSYTTIRTDPRSIGL
jgi:hypothetical protein